MLASFLSSLKEKSGADKRCRANLPAVRLQGQARDKTGLQIRLETPTAEPRAAMGGEIFGPDIKWKEEALELCGRSSQEINYTDAPASRHLQHLMTFCSPSSRALVWDHNKLSWRFLCQQMGLSRNLMLQKSGWRELAQYECEKRSCTSLILPHVCPSFTALS